MKIFIKLVLPVISLILVVGFLSCKSSEKRPSGTQPVTVEIVYCAYS